MPEEHKHYDRSGRHVGTTVVKTEEDRTNEILGWILLIVFGLGIAAVIFIALWGILMIVLAPLIWLYRKNTMAGIIVTIALIAAAIFGYVSYRASSINNVIGNVRITTDKVEYGTGSGAFEVSFTLNTTNKLDLAGNYLGIQVELPVVYSNCKDGKDISINYKDKGSAVRFSRNGDPGHDRRFLFDTTNLGRSLGCVTYSFDKPRYLVQVAIFGTDEWIPLEQASPTPVAATSIAAPSAETSAPTSPAADQPTEDTTQTRYVTADALNLRKDPGTNGTKLVTLRKRTRVTLLGESKTIDGAEWVKVRSGDLEGWVASKFLSDVIDMTPTPYGANSPFYGTWRGEVKDRSDNTYILIWTIQRDGDKIKGTIHTELDRNHAVYADTTITGLISGNTLTYIERDLVASPGSTWCLTSGVLRLEGSGLVAEVSNQPNQSRCPAQTDTIHLVAQ